MSGQRYKYGIVLPKNFKDAIYILDVEEGNHLWQNSIQLEHHAFEDAKLSASAGGCRNQLRLLLLLFVQLHYIYIIFTNYDPRLISAGKLVTLE